MPARISPIRRSQMMQAEIESLRRERLLLRGALADIAGPAVDMSSINAVKAYALGVLTKLPATRHWDDPLALTQFDRARPHA